MRVITLQKLVLITLKKIALNSTLVLFFSAVITSANAIEFNATGVLNNTQTGSLIVNFPGSQSQIVIADSLNTPAYQNLYINQLPFLDPDFRNLSESFDFKKIIFVRVRRNNRKQL